MSDWKGTQADELLDHKVLREAAELVDADLWRQFKASNSSQERERIHSMASGAPLIFKALRKISGDSKVKELQSG